MLQCEYLSGHGAMYCTVTAGSEISCISSQDRRSWPLARGLSCGVWSNFDSLYLYCCIYFKISVGDMLLFTLNLLYDMIWIMFDLI